MIDGGADPNKGEASKEELIGFEGFVDARDGREQATMDVRVGGTP